MKIWKKESFHLVMLNGMLNKEQDFGVLIEG